MTKLKIARSTGLFLAFISPLLVSTPTTANPTTYSILQSGWSGGGNISGFFSGEDLNSDGYIDLAGGEVGAYEISFTGDIFVPDFTHTLADLDFFTYTVGSSGFRPSFPLYSFDSSYFYDADDHLIGLPDLSVTTFTTQDASVKAVPAPTTVSIMAAGFFALASVSRRRRL
ncbi:MAG: hypothetical protein OEW58_07810 [Gammaproteobacteria bacterium]|nr:hypothetical protein [Gammaproteobacteria bacterium]